MGGYDGGWGQWLVLAPQGRRIPSVQVRSSESYPYTLYEVVVAVRSAGTALVVIVSVPYAGAYFSVHIPSILL